MRTALGIIMLAIALGCLVVAGVVAVNAGYYADATGTVGAIPAGAWVAGVAALVALVGGIVTLRRSSHMRTPR